MSCVGFDVVSGLPARVCVRAWLSSLRAVLAGYQTQNSNGFWFINSEQSAGESILVLEIMMEIVPESHLFCRYGFAFGQDSVSVLAGYQNRYSQENSCRNARSSTGESLFLVKIPTEFFCCRYGLAFRQDSLSFVLFSQAIMKLKVLPKTRNTKLETRNLKPETRNPKLENRNPKPETRDPKSETRETKNQKKKKTKPGTQNPEPGTRNPEPGSRNSKNEMKPGIRNPRSKTVTPKPGGWHGE